MAEEILKDIKSLTSSTRTKKVDYADMRAKADHLIGAKMAIAWAYKFNIHGEKLKDDDHVTVNGETMNATQLKDRLSKQAGWTEYEARRVAGTQKTGSKDILTIGRLAKAHAGFVSKLIHKKVAILSDDLKAIKATADGCDLPDEYCYLNAPYGMDERKIKEHDADLIKFYRRFNEVIASAVAAGWIVPTSSKVRDHVADYENYKVFRGIGSSK
jgi:hypothetical protein